MEIRGGCPGHGEPRTGGRWRGEQGAACCLGGTRGAPRGGVPVPSCSRDGTGALRSAPGPRRPRSAPPRPAPGSAGLQGPQVGRGARGGRAGGEVRKAEMQAWSAGGRQEPRRRGNGTAQGCPPRWSCTAHRVLGGSCGVPGGPRALYGAAPGQVGAQVRACIGTWLALRGNNAPEALSPRRAALRCCAARLGARRRQTGAVSGVSGAGWGLPAAFGAS